MSLRLLSLLLLVGLTQRAMSAEPDAAKPDTAKPKTAAPDATAPDTAGLEFFEKKIRPVLVKHCYECHSAKSKAIKGALLLDTRVGTRKGGESGPSVVPGKIDDSLLLSALQYDSFEMPPKGKLPKAVIADFEQWVKMGAPDPREAMTVIAKKTIDYKAAREFWSFRPITKPNLPPVRDASWPRNDIDRFVLAQLEAKNLKPVGPAEKRTLIRRATFDLIGLPPTPKEIEEFLADTDLKAFEKVVSRLLASPHYGERWGRRWLDVARYGEDQAHTFKARKYPSGFRYRDWVVKSLNDDMPYDRFVSLQIAGDLLDGPDRNGRLAALGLFALGPVYYADNGEKKKAMADEWDDRIDTLIRGVQGLTVSCARCHDHKFDPISMQDYYGIAGVFASTDYKEYPIAPQEMLDKKKQADDAVKEQDKKQRELINAEKKRLTAEAPMENGKKKPLPKKGKDLEKLFSDKAKADLKTIRAELDKRKKATAAIKIPVVHSLIEGKSQDLKIYLSGDPEKLGDVVPRGFLRVIAGAETSGFKTKGSGRLELAAAIASKNNPLTARVIVNRVWRGHFGRGIVRTPSNFGSLGERPTHPQLLDFLASSFIENGWSLKTLHKQIMLSAVYRSSSEFNAAANEVDPENRLLWRMNRRRLEVEPWRDAMLAVSGQLDRNIGGPSINLSSKANKRRTLYGFVSRHKLDDVLHLFDFPDPNITIAKRSETTVPLQLLFVLNSEFMTSQAKTLSARLMSENMENDAARIERAYQLLFGRSPTAVETEVGTAFVGEAKVSTDGLSQWEQYALVLLGSNEFTFVD